MLLVVAVPITGAEMSQKIEALLVEDLNFQVDGESWIPKETDGSPLLPILYKDRTYVPVRSLLEEQGVDVGYEADSKTVILDFPKAEKSDMMTETKDDADEMQMDKEVDTKSMISPPPRILFPKIIIRANPDFDPGDAFVGAEFKQEVAYKIEEDTKIMIDGETYQAGDEKLMAMVKDLSPYQIEVVQNEKMDAIEAINILTGEEMDGDQPISTKIKIRIEIEGPPFKVKIILTF